MRCAVEETHQNRVILIRVACHPFSIRIPTRTFRYIAAVRDISCLDVLQGQEQQLSAMPTPGWMVGWLLNELAAFVTQQRSLACHPCSGSVGRVMFFNEKYVFVHERGQFWKPHWWRIQGHFSVQGYSYFDNWVITKANDKARMQQISCFQPYLSQFSAFLRFMLWYIQCLWALGCWTKFDLLTAFFKI